MLKKIVVYTLLLSKLIVADEVIPFEFYNQLDINNKEYQNKNGLKITSKDTEGIHFDRVEGNYWNYEYKLEGVKRKTFIKSIEENIKSREGNTILFKGSDYVFFKLYDKKNLYKGKIVHYKNKYSVEIVREGAIAQSSNRENIILKNLQFDSNKATLKKGAEGEIERIFQFLVENSTYIVEIQGHTDSSGNNKANLILSQKRANRVREVLIEKGVDKDRIKAKGYGETFAIANNKTKEGRRKNRRVELKIISE